MSGLLDGVRVLELGGIGPVPFAGMVLADLGALVLRVERPGGEGIGAATMARGKHVVVVDAKEPAGLEALRRVAGIADVLIEGFRPGVLERLGLDPEGLHVANPGLVIVRTTGFGQTGPAASRAGHDITYLARSGALGATGARSSPPLPPLNLLADFGSGGMLTVVGALAGLAARSRTGEGCVIDAAMVDGVVLAETMVLGMLREGAWEPVREANLLDGGAPFYRSYRCQDGRWLAVGALEPRFFAALVEGLGLADRFSPADQQDRSQWGAMRCAFEAAFATAPRDEWVRRLGSLDACVEPVLGLDELPRDEHVCGRGLFVTVDDHLEPAPAPRVVGAAPVRERPGPRRDPLEALVAFGVERHDAEALVSQRVVA